MNTGDKMNNCKMLKALLWKNLLYLKSHYILVPLQVLFPILLFLFLGYFSNKVPPPTDNPDYHDSPIPESELYQESDRMITRMYYAPQNELTKQIISKVSERTLIPEENFIGYPDEATLLKQFNSTVVSNGILIFEMPDDGKSMSYTLRISKNILTTSVFITPNVGAEPMHGHTYFAYAGFQIAIDKAIIELNADKELKETISVQMFPYPASKRAASWFALYIAAMPFLTVVSFSVVLLFITSNLILEKNTGIKELMQMMGVRYNILWISHYISYLIFTTIIVISITLVVIFYPGDQLLHLSDKSIFFITMFLYANYLILAGFLFSTFTSRSTLGCVILGVIWLLSCYLSMSVVKNPLNTFLSALSCFLPNLPIYQYYKNVGLYELAGSGSTYNNIFDIPTGNGLSVLAIWGMLLLNIAIYSVLIWYIDQVNPGRYGIPKPWNFPLIKALKTSNLVTDNSESEEVNPNSDVIEKFPNQKTYISIQKLSKIFGSWIKGKTVAISNLSFNIYKDGVTVLLGHNGAGKTTLMSIITGMITPSSGTVLIDDNDIRYDMSKIHSNIGFCPQENLIFPFMTVREHLIFFSLVKGFTKEQGKKESDGLLSQLSMTDKANEKSSHLSGGMQRRLQLAIALSGSASLLILDEPTSGLDPETRRELWDIILELRNTRTILLTTHSMEEADALGNKVVIMDHGKLICYGTPMFLKSKYQTGYKLHLYKENNFNMLKVSQLINNIVLKAEWTEDQEKVVFNLPFEESSKYTELFKRLELEKDSLGIKDIRLLTTSLEDVFLKVTHSKVLEDEDMVKNQFDYLDSVEMQDKKVSICHLYCSRMIGLWERKFYYIRNSSLYATLLLILIAWISAALLFLPSTNKRNNIRVKMDLSMYDRNKLTVFISDKIKTKNVDLYLENFNAQVKPVPDVIEALNNSVTEDPSIYGKTVIIGVDYDGNLSYTALYSTSVLHALPTAVNFVTNLISNEIIMPRVDPYITAYARNLPDLVYFEEATIDLLSAALTTSIAMSFLLVISVSFPIDEKNYQSRKLNLLTGINPFFYWFCNWIFDFTLILLLSLVVFILSMVFYEVEVTIPLSAEMWGIHFLGILMYCLSGLAFVYFLSFIIHYESIGFAFIFIMNLLFGIFAPLVIFIVKLFGTINWTACWIIGILFPPFNLTNLYFSVGSLVESNTACLKANKNTSPDKVCCGIDEKTGQCTGLKSYFSDDALTILGIMLCSFLLYWTLVFLIEFSFIERVVSSFIYKQNKDLLKDKKSKPKPSSKTAVKSDDVLSAINLSKIYQTNPLKKPMAAAKHVDIEIRKGECIGLLGINGAGKTTLLKMMTGYEIPSTGDSAINTFSLKNNRRKYLSQIGYCPQFDGLDYYLTGRQILVLFCRLRGVHFDNIDGEVRSILNLTGLAKAADRKCGEYSGGMRRRLNAAVSLIANRQFILLDEPTTGVDPGARSIFHSVMQKMKSQGRSMLLSTHNLNECEKLCDSLAIMSKGRILHKGSVPELKAVYASGYILTIKLKTGNTSTSAGSHGASHDVVDGSSMSQLVPLGTLNSAKKTILKLKDRINKEFNCSLRDEHSNILQYQLKTSLPFGELFGTMDTIKDSFFDLIEVYTIADTSLEELFLIMQKQDDAELLEDQLNIV